MRVFEKKCFWTLLSIKLFDTDFSPEILEKVNNQLENFENTYSRFIRGNYLWQLNHEKSAHLLPELASMLKICQKAHIASHGYFDISVRPQLENLWYGIEEAPLKEVVDQSAIEIKDNIIFLRKNISLDLGSIGKWYMIDILTHILLPMSNNFIVNFGGDIRVRGTHTIFLEDPRDTTQKLWSLTLKDASLASSGILKRKIGKDSHHLINPYNGKSEEEVVGVFVLHKLASIADCFATALSVSPFSLCEEISQSIPEMYCWIFAQDGRQYQHVAFSSLR